MQRYGDASRHRGITPITAITAIASITSMHIIKPLALAVALATLLTAASIADTPADVRSHAREMFRQVIAMRTAEGQGQVPAMARYLAEQFRSAGFAQQDVHVLPIRDTAALVVRYRGDGSGGRPILLLAHMDVVPAKPEEWQRDPYTLVEENGYFFGRGTLDNKQGVVALTATFLRLKQEGFVPTRDLIVAFTGDEETGGHTALSLAGEHRALIDAEFAINSDDGGGQLDDATGAPQYHALVGAEKVSATFQLTVRNPGGHSSAPRADNAIYELANALRKVQAHRFPVMSNDWTRGSFAAAGPLTGGELGAAMTRFAANPKDESAANVLFNAPNEVGKTRTTCVATMLDAGHAPNALPQTATATVNCRIFPGMKAAEVRATLQELAGKGVEVSLLREPHEAGPSPLRPDIVAAVTKAVHAHHPGVAVVPTMVPWATDGVIFRGAGIPTYGVAGTFIKGADAFSHGLNERIPVQSFYDELTHWYVLIKELAGKG